MSEAALPKPATSIVSSFSAAGWLVILGVVTSWVYLQQDRVQVAQDLPQIPALNLDAALPAATESLLDLAAQAYAAGRITQPEGSNALHYYQAHLAAVPGSEEALAGLNRVGTYLINDSERAMLAGDWATARQRASDATGIRSTSLAAGSVLARLDRRERIGQLLGTAAGQLAEGNLTRPADANALASYRAVLKLDPANAAALDGVDDVARGLAALAQTAAFEENQARAKSLIAEAKKIAPEASGISETEKLIAEWSTRVEDQALQDDLLAASQAYQAGYLLDSDRDGSQRGALSLYQAVLQRAPDSRTAGAGVDLVLSGLVERAWAMARDEQVAQAKAVISTVRAAGAKEALLADVASEIEFLERLALARAGQFNEVLPLSQLEVRRRVEPAFQRAAGSGYVELLMTVDEQGSVKDVEVVGSDNRNLHAEARRALQRWRFEPVTHDGRPIPVRTGIRFTYQS